MVRNINYNFSGWTIYQFFRVDGNFSIFGRNSRVSKVLAHETSDEIQNKLKNSSLTVWLRELLVILSGWVLCKFVCWGKFSIFCRNSWVSKVLTHEISGEIQKKIKIFEFYGMKFDGVMKGHID